jgi:hypothetical protein
MAPRLSRFLPVLAVALSAAVGLAGPAPTAAQSAQAAVESPGAKGAQVYCFMRANGNSHEVSWAAAYALIKRQSASMFRTSPEHAAVMITEAVVQNPASFPDCGRYLGDLYSRRVQEGSAAGANGSTGPTGSPSSAAGSGMTRGDRYGN